MTMTAMQNMRSLWLLVLVCFLSGCANVAYHPAAFPDDGRNQNDGVAKRIVRLGSTVRVTLTSGEKVSGLVAQLTDTEALIRPKGSGGSMDRLIAFEDIASVEQETPSDRNMLAWTLVGVGVLTVAYVAVMVSLDPYEEY